MKKKINVKVVYGESDVIKCIAKAVVARKEKLKTI